MRAGSDGKKKTTCGYKSHIIVDEDHLIKVTDFTAANVYYSQSFTILLSDDEPAVAESIKLNLESEGYLVMVANDGKQALAMLETDDIDLLL